MDRCSREIMILEGLVTLHCGETLRSGSVGGLTRQAGAAGTRTAAPSAATCSHSPATGSTPAWLAMSMAKDALPVEEAEPLPGQTNSGSVSWRRRYTRGASRRALLERGLE